MIPSTLRGERFGEVPLPEVLGGLHRSAATGVLRVVGLGATRELILVDGELRAARSDAENEKLGSWLVGRGVISSEDKQQVLSLQEGSDAPPLGHLLVKRQLVTEPALEEELEGLALRILERATADRRQSAEFMAGDQGGQLDTLPRIATPQLIVCSARALQDLQAKRSAVASNGSIVCVDDTVDAVVQSYDLEMAESILIGKLHRERTVEALKGISMLPEHQFVSALYALKSAGIVSFRRPDEPPRKRAAKTSGPAPAPDVITDHEITADPLEERQEVRQRAAVAGRVSHYQLLGVDEGGSYREVFDAWNEFQRRFHPRRGSEPHLSDLRETLRALYEKGEEAFQILSSPERRPRYDRILRSRQEPSALDQPGSAGTVPSKAEIARANVERAEEQARQGDLFQAIRSYEQACDLDPKPQTLLRLAQLMLVNPQWANRALEKLRRAVEIDPRFVDGWLEVAEFWHRRKSPERQRKALERAVATNPDHAKAVDRYRSLVGEDGLRRFLDRVRRGRG